MEKTIYILRIHCCDRCGSSEKIDQDEIYCNKCKDLRKQSMPLILHNS
jgi:hypothetical protein